MNKIVITGGAGFIGSHILERACGDHPDAEVVVYDKMTYAGDIRNIQHLLTEQRIDLVVGDICDFDLARRVLEDADLLIHAAAESHVDNSFGNSLHFTMTNVYGTHVLMEASRLQKVPRIVHISTDEVYGEILTGDSDEDSALNPTNPYSASKAGAEMAVRGYLACYRMPIIVVRANNIFGIRQFPEKIVPKFTLLQHFGMKLPIHGTGKNRRHYLAAEDFAEAIMLLVHQGRIGEIYNVGSHDERTNLEVARMICDIYGHNVEDAVILVEDRPFNDARYSIATDKIAALGWEPRRNLRDELPRIVHWYRENSGRFRSAMGLTKQAVKSEVPVEV